MSPKVVPRFAGKKGKQLLLGLAAPATSKGKARFERETLRRGGPLYLQGFRWKDRKAAGLNDTKSLNAAISALLPNLGKMPK